MSSSRTLASLGKYLLLELLLVSACTFDSAGLPPGAGDSALGDSAADLPDAALPDLPPADLTDAAPPDLSPELPLPDLPLLDLPLPDLPPADLPLPDLSPDLPPTDLPSLDLSPDLPPPDLPPPDSYPQPPPNTIYAFAAPPSGITIDGDLTEWTGGWITIASPADWFSTGGSSSGPSDISAKLAARWDAAALYLAFEVTDDVHSNTHDADTLYLYEGDSVQIGLDMANNDGSPYDTTDDFEYGWALTSSNNQIRHRWAAPTGAPAMANTFAVKRTGSMTTYEVRLPLSDLGLSSLAAGKSAGFGALVNENDGSGRDGFIEWTTGIGWGQKNPGAFGLLTLMP